MGILPMLSSYLQALVWGANPITLVSGGTVIWVLVVASTFWLAWKAFGPEVAGWSIVPLVFSSLGTIWLSGRITGGHLLTLVWHIVAFAGLYASPDPRWLEARGGPGGLVRAGPLPRCHVPVHPRRTRTRRPRSPGFDPEDRERRSCSPRCSWCGLMAGLVPREIGRWVDPYDAYPAQFATTFERPALLEHARLLMLNCLPRLIAGPELSDFQRNFFEVDSQVGEFLVFLSGSKTNWRLPRASEWVSVLIVAGFGVAIVRLLVDSARAGTPARQAIGCGTIVSALLIVSAFLVNRNIFNSDNYRYLIFLLIPWALGFGLTMNA